MKHNFFFLALLSATLILGCKNPPDKKDVPKVETCTKYACPMHPDRTSVTPAECPECHMKMEPLPVQDTIKKDSTLYPKK
jgi:hypothetical protein